LSQIDEENRFLKDDRYGTLDEKLIASKKNIDNI